MGGVGKTQAAARLARDALDAGHAELVVWVNAKDRASVIAEYARTAASIGLRVTGNADADALRLREWLESTRRRWMVILDDVTTPADLEGLWPPENTRGRALVTTRLRHDNLIGRGPHTQLPVYTRRQSADYLAERLTAARHRLAPAADLEGLAEDLGDLPLALSQAAAFIIHEGLDVARYRLLLADRTRRLADSFPTEDLPDGQTAALPALWSLSLERASSATPNRVSRPLMELIGMLDRHGIPTRVLSSAPARIYFHHRSIAGPRMAAYGYAATIHRLNRRWKLWGQIIGRHEVSVAVRVLDRLNLITHDPDTHLATVHQLVQRAALDAAADGLRPALAARRRQLTAVTAADSLLAVWPAVERDAQRAERLRSNVAALHMCAARELWNDRPFLGKRQGHRVLFKHADSLAHARQFAAAIHTMADMCAQALEHLGPDHPDTLSARHSLARWRGEAGDAAAAVVELEGVLADRTRVQGPDHPHTLGTRYNLAYWRGEAGDAADAVADFEALLADRLRLLGPDHRNTLTTRLELAQWRGTAGDPARAAADCKALLSDRTRLLGPNHRDTLTTRHHLASWRGFAGDAPGAVASLERLLAHRERVLGPDDPDTLATRHSLASWRRKVGGAVGTVARLEAQLVDQAAVLAPDHRDVLTTRLELAYWRRKAGDPAGAAADWQSLLPDQLRVLGPDHPDTLFTRHELAYRRGEAGNPALAAADLEALLAHQARLLGPDHQNTLATRYTLAYWRGHGGDAAGAASDFESLLPDRLRVLGPDHPDTLMTLHELAYWRGQAGNPAGAIIALEDLLSAQTRIFGLNHDRVLDTRRSLDYWRSKAEEPTGN